MAGAATLLLLAAGCAAVGGATSGPVLAIVGAAVVNVERDRDHAIDRDMTVLIEGERIRAIGPAATTPVPPGATVLQARGKWVVPGLIDTHVHFFQSGDLYTRPDVVDLNSVVSYRDEVARNKARLDTTLRVWLASGVTSVIDVGGPMWNFDVRARARASAHAPDVYVAGPLISLIADPPLDLGDPPIIQARTPEEAEALARAQVAHKPDFVKVWFIHGPQGDLAAETEIVRRAGAVAHAAGIPFAVHATELDVAKAALQAGADFLVHSVEDKVVDDAFIALLKQRGAVYCPTLFVTLGYDLALSDQWVATETEARRADPDVLARLRGIAAVPRERLPKWVGRLLDEKAPPRLSPVMAENLRKVWAAGVPVALGTDAGNIGTVHGPSVFREMALMHEAGLSELEVLRSATLHGAKVLRRDDLGTIAPGKLADLLVVDADPLVDLGALSRAHRVIKKGRVFAPDDLR